MLLPAAEVIASRDQWESFVFLQPMLVLSIPLQSAGDFATIAQVTDPDNHAAPYLNRAYGLNAHRFLCGD